MRRSLAVSVVALALLLPAAASADSIVYTKDHDVWLARPDGSGAQQLTRDGGYQSPTQANDGTILAQRGTRFIRLDRAGRPLATLNSVLTDAPVTASAVGPFDPRISPDGTKLAYWLGMYSSWHDYRNNIEWNRTGPVTVWQDARTGQFLGATHSYEKPSWLPDSSGALLFEETNALTAQVVAAGVGVDHNHIKQWFHDSDTKWSNEEYWKPIGAGDISSAMDRLAVLRGGTHIGAGGLSAGAGNTIAIYGVHLPDPPTTGPSTPAGFTTPADTPVIALTGEERAVAAALVSRFRAPGALAERPATRSEIAAATNLAERTVIRRLESLASKVRLGPHDPRDRSHRLAQRILELGLDRQRG